MTEIYPKFVALSEVSPDEGQERFQFLFLPGEQVLKAYRSVRDRLILTDRRIIAIDIQGLTGRKVEYMVIPYSKVTAFSVETAGTFDLDGEMKVWVSGLGRVEFEFVKSTNVGEIARILSQYIV